MEKDHKKTTQQMESQIEQITFDIKDRESKAEQKMKLQNEEIQMMREKINSLL